MGGEFAKVWLPNPRAGLDCKIIQSPIPLRCLIQWLRLKFFYSLHGWVGLRSFYLQAILPRYWNVRYFNLSSKSNCSMLFDQIYWKVNKMEYIIGRKEYNKSNKKEET